MRAIAVAIVTSVFSSPVTFCDHILHEIVYSYVQTLVVPFNLNNSTFYRVFKNFFITNFQEFFFKLCIFGIRKYL